MSRATARALYARALWCRSAPFVSNDVRHSASTRGERLALPGVLVVLYVRSSLRAQRNYCLPFIVRPCISRCLSTVVQLRTQMSNENEKLVEAMTADTVAAMEAPDQKAALWAVYEKYYAADYVQHNAGLSGADLVGREASHQAYLGQFACEPARLARAPPMRTRAVATLGCSLQRVAQA